MKTELRCIRAKGSTSPDIRHRGISILRIGSRIGWSIAGDEIRDHDSDKFRSLNIHRSTIQIGGRRVTGMLAHPWIIQHTCRPFSLPSSYPVKVSHLTKRPAPSLHLVSLLIPLSFLPFRRIMRRMLASHFRSSLLFDAWKNIEQSFLLFLLFPILRSWVVPFLVALLLIFVSLFILADRVEWFIGSNLLRIIYSPSLHLSFYNPFFLGEAYVFVFFFRNLSNDEQI